MRIKIRIITNKYVKKQIKYLTTKQKEMIIKQRQQDKKAHMII